MSTTEIGIIGLLVLVVLLLSGIPVGFTLFFIGFFGFAMVSGMSGALGNLFIIPFNIMNNYNFGVIPLFLLMSEIVGQTGISRETYDSARVWLGQFRGGLAMATIGACGLFSMVSGSSLAGTIVMGRMAYPEMKRVGYSSRLAGAVTAAGGTLGILIPPSMGFVVIGILTELSIGKLFMAGILPGISVLVFYWATIFIWSKIDPKLAPSLPKTNMKEKITAVKYTWPILALFVLMMGGIYGGVFTATEAAGIGAFGAVVIAVAKRQLSGGKFWQCLMDSSMTTAMLIIMIVGAFMFNSFLAITRIPFSLGEFLSALDVSRYVLLVIVIIFYLICGMFLDIFAILILTIPIFYPVMDALGFDLIWYSVLMVRIIEIGFISPPFGINLFGLAGIINEPLGVLYRGIIPFVISDILNIALLIAFPAISTWIPSLM